MDSLQQLAKRGFDLWQRDRPRVISVDTETTGLGFFDEAFCVTIAWTQPTEAPHPGQVEAHYFELVDFDASLMVMQILQETPVWVFHNCKFDLQKLVLAGLLDRADITPDRFEDTEAFAHLLDGNQKKALKWLAGEYLGEPCLEEEELKKARTRLKLKKDDGYHVLPREVLVPYAIKDVDYTIRLYELFKPQLEAWDDLSRLYAHEKLVTLALLDMEAAGMKLDTEYLEVTAKQYATEHLMTELRIRDMTHEDFLPTSWQQVLAEFEKRGFKLPNTQADTLEQVDDDLAREILKLRELKNRRNYFDAMVREQREGIIHPNFRQHGTATGRMSSGEAEA